MNQNERPKPAKKLASNESFTLAVNDIGDLYSWGNNKYHKLGIFF